MFHGVSTMYGTDEWANNFLRINGNVIFFNFQYGRQKYSGTTLPIFMIRTYQNNYVCS